MSPQAQDRSKRVPLNFHYSITHHLSLKIPKFPKPCTFGTLFSTSHHSNICTFCETYTWAIGQRLLLAYLPHPHSPPFSSQLISFCHPQSQCQCATKEVQTTKTLNNLTPPKAAHHPKFKTPFILIYDTPPNQQQKKTPRKIARPISHTKHKPNKTHVSILSN